MRYYNLCDVKVCSFRLSLTLAFAVRLAYIFVIDPQGLSAESQLGCRISNQEIRSEALRSILDAGKASIPTLLGLRDAIIVIAS